MEFRKMLIIALFAEQKKRHRFIEQSFRLWEKARVGCFKRTASKHVYYQGWNRSPAQLGCMRQELGPSALGRPRESGWRGRWEGVSGWGTHVNPWSFHFNVWQNSLQIKKINKRIKKKMQPWYSSYPSNIDGYFSICLSVWPYVDFSQKSGSQRYLIQKWVVII